MAASNAVWDSDGSRAISARQVQLVRDAGALAELPLHLSALALGDRVESATSRAPTRFSRRAIASRRRQAARPHLGPLSGSGPCKGKKPKPPQLIASAIKQAAAGAGLALT